MDQGTNDFKNEKLRQGVRPAKVVSGGQTGVDRAALDAALEAGLRTGGWCPRGRRSENGPIPKRYPLAETPSEGYEQRTIWNVRDSDATLIVARGNLSGGTALTEEVARRQGKPNLTVAPDPHELAIVEAWIARFDVQVLNVAGPRDSPDSSIYADAHTFLLELFRSSG